MAKTVTPQKEDPYVETLLREFTGHQAARDIDVSGYCGDVRRFARWQSVKYGDFDPTTVATLDVVEYRGYLQEQRKVPGTINHALTSLSVFFKWLAEVGDVRRNPAAGVRRAVMACQPAPRWLTRIQQMALLHAVQNNLSDMAMMGLMLHAGLRVSELCGLDRNDIEISERKGLVRVRHGKGNRYREVPLNKTVRKMINNWTAKNPQGPLFPNRYGQPITVHGVEKMFAQYASGPGYGLPRTSCVIRRHANRQGLCTKR